MISYVPLLYGWRHSLAFVELCMTINTASPVVAFRLDPMTHSSDAKNINIEDRNAELA